MTLYNPVSHQTVYSPAGNTLEKLWGVDKLALDLASLGLINLFADATTPPADTSRLWLHTVGLAATSGVVKRHDGLAWVPLDVQGFRAHLGASGTNVSLPASSITDASPAGQALLTALTSAAQLTALGALPLVGGTMTGAITLAADPVTNLEATTKAYVDTALSSAITIAQASSI